MSGPRQASPIAGQALPYLKLSSTSSRSRIGSRSPRCASSIILDARISCALSSRNELVKRLLDALSDFQALSNASPRACAASELKARNLSIGVTPIICDTSPGIVGPRNQGRVCDPCPGPVGRVPNQKKKNQTLV